MEFSRLVLLCLPAVWALATTAGAAADVPAARSPGCATRCGDVDVPYPFGLDTRCAIHAGFWLNCTNTTAGGSARLLFKNGELTRISVQDGKAWFKTWISRQCYDQTTNQTVYDTAWINLNNTPYVLSADDNKVIVLGCRSMAYMQSNSVSNSCSFASQY